jgi:hypothetical protein
MEFFFWDEEVFERISKAETDYLRVLYEIVFGAKEVSSWCRRKILRLDGFDFAEGSPDYNSLEELIYRYDSRSLRFVSWLLNVETNGTSRVNRALLMPFFNRSVDTTPICFEDTTPF